MHPAISLFLARARIADLHDQTRRDVLARTAGRRKHAMTIRHLTRDGQEPAGRLFAGLAASLEGDTSLTRALRRMPGGHRAVG